MTSWILIASAASATFMAGVIWVIQLVHYPLFALADPLRFSAFHAEHSTRITLIVGPAMLLELGTAAALVLTSDSTFERRAAVLGVMLVGLAWIVTATCSIPAHARLGQGFDAVAHGSLVRTNILRTIAWTLHAMLKLYLVGRRLGPMAP